MNNKLLIADQSTGKYHEPTKGLRKFIKHIDLPAPANLHTQFTSGAAINASSGFSMPDPSRTVQVVVGASGVACTFTVTGLRFGAVQTEAIVGTGAGTFQGTKAFDSITSFTSSVDPADTVDLKSGSGVGLPEAFDGSLVRYSVDGVDTAITGSDGPSGTVLINPSSPPNGARDYAITYNPAF